MVLFTNKLPCGERENRDWRERGKRLGRKGRGERLGGESRGPEERGEKEERGEVRILIKVTHPFTTLI